MKATSHKRKPMKWAPQSTTHFALLVLLVLAGLFLVFYFFLRNTAH